MTPTLVSADPTADTDATHSGFVDLIDTRRGVRGWAVNHANPLHPVRLLLCVGDREVAETLAEETRYDISEKLGRPARAGFAFHPDVMRLLPDFMEDPAEHIWVRVAATGHALSSDDGPPDIGGIVDRIRADALLDKPNTTPDFTRMIEELRTRAQRLLQEDLVPAEEGLEGYLETFAADATGPVWFMGWMKRDHLQEFSAVLEDGRGFAAAVAVLTYVRDDLPLDCCGVAGLIASDWRPSPDTADVQLFFGSGGRFHLRSNRPLRFIPPAEFVLEYDGIRERCFGRGRATELSRLMSLVESWFPTRLAAQLSATECSIDRILLIPGLGCMVEGWVMSPLKRIESLRLRVGESVMSADPESLYWKPRPDLLRAFPASGRMVERAGFVGLFAGPAEPDDFADPVFKVVFQGGASANWGIEAGLFRRLGHSANVEDARLFFPALQEEGFFPRFAEAAIQAERGAMTPPVALSVAHARQAMVFVLPEDRCDLFLLFEELAHQCRTAGGIDAVAFIAAAKSNRSDALWLFREFQTAYGAASASAIACSLLVIDDAGQAFALLPEILREIGAHRFVFVGPGVFLRESGWALARQALAQDGSGLVFFGLEAEEFEPADAPSGATARCFAWSLPGLARWAGAAPSFMGGFHRDNGLLQSGAAHIVHPDAAACTRSLVSTRVQQAVNAAVYGRFAEPRPPASQVTA